MRPKITIDIELKIKDLKDMLYNKLRPSGSSEQTDLIVDVIIDNLAITPKGLSQLFMSFNNIAPSSIFKMGDEVLIDINQMTSWNKDLPKTKEVFAFQDKIKATVYSINLQKEACITVKFLACDKSGSTQEFEEDYREYALCFDENGLME